MDDLPFRVFDAINRYRLLFSTLRVSLSALAILLGMTVFVGFMAAQQEDVSVAVQRVKTKALESEKEIAVVREIFDGDTVLLEDGRKVRYIGINAPEQDECFAKSSTKANEVIVKGKTVKLERDVSETDPYGRLLRYIWIGDTLVNEKLVEGGFARSTPIAPDLKYNARIYAAQREARGADKGLWGFCY